MIADSTAAPDIDDRAVLDAYPDTRLDHLNKVFYAGLLRGQLVLGRCAACQTWQTPLRPLCPACWSTKVVPTPVSGQGTVFLLTRLHQGPPAAGVGYSPPWPLAAVELVEQPGLRLCGTIVDCPPPLLHAGLKVAVTWIERDGAPWYAFRPAVPGEPS